MIQGGSNDGNGGGGSGSRPRLPNPRLKRALAGLLLSGIALLACSFAIRYARNARDATILVLGFLLAVLAATVLVCLGLVLQAVLAGPGDRRGGPGTRPGPPPSGSRAARPAPEDHAGKPVPPANGLDTGNCPWCGGSPAPAEGGPAALPGLGCACGAIAWSGAIQDYSLVVDAMVNHFGISPSRIHGNIHEPENRSWFSDFHLEIKAVEPGSAGKPSTRWWWFKRSLPWEPPSGPMTDAERLAWLTSQGEKFYDLMYDSASPRSEFREAKEALEDAIALAGRMGRSQEVEGLSRRLEHIKAVYRNQFSQ